MCLEIFEKSIWTASGEPLARSFDKKMVLAPKPTISFLNTKIEGPFWSVFGGGGAVKINKDHQNEALLKGGGRLKIVKNR